jgi:hypothetical protein
MTIFWLIVQIYNDFTGLASCWRLTLPSLSVI